MPTRPQVLPAEAGSPGLAKLSPEHRVILGLVSPGARVLDLGCGDGVLLQALMETKQVRAEGIELAPECIQACVAAGVPNVHQGDLDEGLADYADQSVDYVILASTLQVLRKPLSLIRDMARVGRQCIIGFPNFAHWHSRWQLAVQGRMPVTDRLPYGWYDTPNIHLTTIPDFRAACGLSGLKILQEIPLRTNQQTSARVRLLPNLLADYAIFVVATKAPGTRT